MSNVPAQLALALLAAIGFSNIVISAEDDLVAMRDGSPGPMLAGLLHQTDDRVADVSHRAVDVIYGRRYGTALTMDVYTPVKGANGAAVIQIVSGGFWSGPEYRRIPLLTNKIRKFAKAGFVVFAVIHGSQPRYTIDEIRKDPSDAVRFIRRHAHRFQIKPDQIGITGISSGGHLALLAAADPPDESAKVQAAVAYAPNTDLLNYGIPNKTYIDHFRRQPISVNATFDFKRWSEVTDTFVPVNDEQRVAILREISPITHVDQKTPPTLLLHGDADDVVPLQQSVDFKHRMDEESRRCHLEVYKDQNHTWRSDSDEDELVIGWFEQHLLGKDQNAPNGSAR